MQQLLGEVDYDMKNYADQARCLKLAEAENIL